LHDWSRVFAAAIDPALLLDDLPVTAMHHEG
jgi:hypothetical protein